MTKESRKGQAPDRLDRQAFSERFNESFADPQFEAAREALAKVEVIAWQAYDDHRKAPRTRKAGEVSSQFADPEYDLSVDWLDTRQRLLAAEAHQKDPGTPSRVLLIVGSARNDGSCAGEVSKSWRLVNVAKDVLQAQGIESDVLDLSELTSSYGRRIHPCKACVSTSMPLCHWPCSCYPNHSLNQVQDWMGEIYEKWTAAHGVIIITPVYWYGTPSVLKLMIDRMVCADGGNPDPTSTGGKDTDKARAIELAGWDYPKHLAGRVYGVFAHGDVAGIEGVRRQLSEWLDWMGLVDAGSQSRLDRFIGYYEPYATNHEALDRDEDVQEEVRNIARAVADAVTKKRAGQLPEPGADLRRVRPK